MYPFKNQLKRIVEGENKLREIARQNLKDILPKLKPFEGKKLFKADGSLVKKAEIKYNRENPISSIYINQGYRRMYLDLSICISGGSYEDRTYYCRYYKDQYYLGDLNEGDLISVMTYEEAEKELNLSPESDIDYEKVKADIEFSEQASKAAEDAKNKIPYNVIKQITGSN